MAAILTSPIVPVPSEDSAPYRGRPQLRVIQGGRGTGSALRANKRRRFLAVVLACGVALVVVIGSALVFSALESAAGPPAAPAGMTTGGTDGSVIVVQSGESLTSIARGLQPTGDITGLVARLAALHGPAPLQAGDRLDLAELGSPGT